MTGYEQFVKLFGNIPLALIIELVFASIFVYVAYKKLEKKIITNASEKEQQKKDIAEALTGVRSLPAYRQQSIQIQKELKDADAEILKTCSVIQAGVTENQKILVERLDRLEDRERNALRAKILEMHRIFTSKKMNPMQAWTEMERDAFNDLIVDYESLNGNGHVHTVVIPDMNMLSVIPITDKKAIEELFHSRQA